MNNQTKRKGTFTRRVKHTLSKKKLVSMYCDEETYQLMKNQAEAETRSLSSWLQIAAIEKLQNQDSSSLG